MKENNTENIIAEYQQQLLSFILAKVANAEDANDLLANVFMKFISQPKMPANPIAWLYLVTKNSIIDYYRAQRPHDSLPDDLIDEEHELDQFQQFAVCILPMLKSMNEKDRSIIQWVDIDGNKQQSAADVLNISLPAFKSRLLRARGKLKKMMFQCCPPVFNKKGTIDAFSAPSKVCKVC